MDMKLNIIMYSWWWWW